MIDRPRRARRYGREAQVPALQNGIEKGQAFPHEPQLVRLVMRSTQAPEHSVSPAAQLPHVPSWQLSSAAQGMSQPPQCAGSLEVSTHEPLHAIRPKLHEVLQLPNEQTLPAPQVVPQVPQFIGSLRVSTQLPPQNVWPDGHVGARQVPASHRPA